MHGDDNAHTVVQGVSVGSRRHLGLRGQHISVDNKNTGRSPGQGQSVSCEREYRNEQ